MQQMPPLLDHPVGLLQKGLWDGEAERFRGFEIDDKLKLARQLYGQIARLCTS